LTTGFNTVLGHFQVNVAKQLISGIWLLYSTILGKLKHSLLQFCYTVILEIFVAASFEFFRKPSSSSCNTHTNFDVLLTVHLSIILVINQLSAQTRAS